MSYYKVSGQNKLFGEVQIQGSKNAALPILCAVLLHQGKTILENVPDILDVRNMLRILEKMGCILCWDEQGLSIDTSRISIEDMDCPWIGDMRSSILLLGALAGRCRGLRLEYPGGCTIGKRPIDLHIYGLKHLGMQIEERAEEIFCDSGNLEGKRIYLPFPSVGATENIMMAAVSAKGVTVIHNAAKEPEIVDLARFLRQMGVGISGEGTSRIYIVGGCSLRDSVYRIMGDRIVAGTYLLATAGTGGEIGISGLYPGHLGALLSVCREMGCQFNFCKDGVYLRSSGHLKSVKDIHTQPYPGFPTDLQSQLMAVLCRAQGTSRIYEHIFENRFQIVEALAGMGADIKINKNRAVIQGVSKLKGTKARAYDLRGGAALVIAGLMAEGDTVVDNSTFVERGYQDLCGDLTRLGATIKQIKEE